jgi:hypothetical protein
MRVREASCRYLAAASASASRTKLPSRAEDRLHACHKRLVGKNLARLVDLLGRPRELAN